MSQKGKPVVDMSNMGFLHVERQFKRAFQKQLTFFTNGLSMCLISLNDDYKIIGVSTVSHRRYPLPPFEQGNGPLALDTIIPIPAILSSLFVQVFRLQPLIKLIEHDV